MNNLLSTLSYVAPDNTTKTIFKYDEVSSTTDIVISGKLPDGRSISDWEVVYALMQTSGRARGKRRWISTPNENLYFSIALPAYETRHLFPLNIIYGYAICDALNDISNEIYKIKWPNDVTTDGRKCCGILFNSKGNHVNPSWAVGIGININQITFSDEIAMLAASLRSKTGVTYDLDKTLLTVMKWITSYTNDYFCGNIDIKEKWKSYSAFYGKKISVHISGIKEIMVDDGIWEDGTLMAKYENGEHKRIVAGEIGFDYLHNSVFM